MLTVNRQHRSKPPTSQTRMDTGDVGGVGSIGGFCLTHAHGNGWRMESSSKGGGIFYINSDLTINTINTINKASKNQALRCGG